MLLLVRAGVRDTHLLAMVFSAMLFAVPAALYHLALGRVREHGVLLAAMIAVIAVVYLPTCFFIVGEYNIAYAAGHRDLRDRADAVRTSLARRRAAAGARPALPSPPTRR